MYNEAMSLIELCRVQLKVVQFTTDAQINDLVLFRFMIFDGKKF